MQKILIFTTLLILALPAYSKSPKLEGTIWELSYMETEELGINQVENNQIYQSLGDLDGDGVEETMTMTMYMTFEGSQMRTYMRMSYTGSAALLESMGMKPVFTYSQMEYTLKGNIITVDGEDSVYEIKNNELTLTSNEKDKISFVSNDTIDLSDAIPESEMEF